MRGKSPDGGCVRDIIDINDIHLYKERLEVGADMDMDTVCMCVCACVPVAGTL